MMKDQGDQDTGVMIPVYRFTNEIEAQILDDVLKEEGIPHRIRSFHDSAYNGIFQMQKGWGQLEAPESYKERVRELAEQVLNQDSDKE